MFVISNYSAVTSIYMVTKEQNVYCEAYDMSQHTQVESMFSVIMSRGSQLVMNHIDQPIALYKVATLSNSL